MRICKSLDEAEQAGIALARSKGRRVTVLGEVDAEDPPGLWCVVLTRDVPRLDQTQWTALMEISIRVKNLQGAVE